VPESREERQGFPANLPGVLAVASAEAPPDVRTLPSTLFAPGRNVLTLRPGARYDFENGSSMAAANVTGIVALLKSVRPRLNGEELSRVLHDAAARVASSDTRAGPMVNACRAVAAVTGAVGCGELRNMHATRR